MYKRAFALIFAVLMVISLLTACAPKTYTKTGVLTSNAIEGVEETQYVFAVSKNSANGDKYLAEINKILEEIDMAEIIKGYTSGTVSYYEDFLGDVDLKDNIDLPPINIYTIDYSPFQFTGAWGNGVDGVDMYVMAHLAERLNMFPKIQHAIYSTGYEKVKSGESDIFASAVALTDEVKANFKVSNVYASGKQHIVCDEGFSFTKIKQLKGLKIGVVAGREGQKIIEEAIKNGVLKNSGAEIVVFDTDAEAGHAILNENIHALIIDELPAKVITGEVAIRGSMNFG